MIFSQLENTFIINLVVRQTDFIAEELSLNLHCSSVSDAKLKALLEGNNI